jgi:hypothetical protein
MQWHILYFLVITRLQELCKGLDGEANSTYLIPNVDL